MQYTIGSKSYSSRLIIGTGKYPVKWDATHVLWEVPLPGKAGSTPIVHGQRIYLTGPAEGQDAVLAFDFSGRRLWQTTLAMSHWLV